MYANQSEPAYHNNSLQIDATIEQTTRRILRLAANNPKRINQRLQELERETNVDRILQLNAAIIGLSGLVLGVTVSRKWLVLPATVAFFLAQHALQGWCPPMLLLRKMGMRNSQEIDLERCALKMLRGDFGQRVIDADLAWEAAKRM